LIIGHNREDFWEILESIIGKFSSIIDAGLFPAPKKWSGHTRLKVVWNNPVVGEDLCECEVRNPHDTDTVADKDIINGNLTVVVHIP